MAKNMGERVRARREELGMTQDALAKLVGCSQPMIKKIEAGSRTSLGRKLAEALKVSLTFLETGKEEPVTNIADYHAGETYKGVKNRLNSGMISESSSEGGANLDDGDLPIPTEEEFAFVPQLDIAAACGSGRFEDHVVVKGGLAFPRFKLRELGVPERAARIITAAGGSMSPTIQDGRDVLINTADTEPLDGKIYAICMPHHGLVLKRLIWEFNPQAGREVWTIRSDNPDKTTFPDKILPPDEHTRIAGRACWTDSLL